MRDSNPSVGLLPATCLVAVLFGGCVKQSDYNMLQIENTRLQARLSEADQQLQQSAAELNQARLRLQQLFQAQTQLEGVRKELEQTKEELEALKAEFDKFRTQRRGAMLGKKYPVLTLEDGKVLHAAEITAIRGDELAIQHESGFVKVALANSCEELRWEACYDPQAAKLSARDRLLAEARLIEGRLNREKEIPASPAEPEPKRATESAVNALRQQLGAQRRAMNTEFHALQAKNPGALHGAEWNSSQPEASPLLNSLSGSRAVLGLSHLKALRDATTATLQQLRELDSTAR
ncbi:MAG: hypothetical protein U1F71_13995 [Verrucomicrobiaceae bacterium]